MNHFESNTPILIVDDSTQFSMVLKRLLTSIFGFTSVVTLTSTAEALERIIATPEEFRLIFFDFHFPTGMNGGELLVCLKDKGLLINKVVFLMSSDPTAEVLQRVLTCGAAGVIAKPFDRNELKVQLERAERLAFSDQEPSF